MPLTILVADDSRTVRTMVRGALEADNYYLVEVPDGRAALEAASTMDADLVITDVNMPEMDGLTLVKELRARSAYKFTPILVLTTESGDDMKQRGREAGATGWLVKPFDAQRLRQTVSTVLARKRS
jgi:two-component system, chemotaxis family, chemotaxis protein CheY